MPNLWASSLKTISHSTTKDYGSLQKQDSFKPQESANCLLELRNVEVCFGALTALDGLNLKLFQGELVGLIGQNGSGKTTLLNVISGFVRQQRGEVLFKNRAYAKSWRIAQAGIARTFQDGTVFDSMTVIQNILCARHTFIKTNLLQQALYWGKNSAVETEQYAYAYSILSKFGIEKLANQEVGQLSYGLRKMVAMARAVAQSPDLLLLDEPLSGLSTENKLNMLRLIQYLHQVERQSILMIEHDTQSIFDYCQRVVVLEAGRKLMDDTAEVIARHYR